MSGIGWMWMSVMTVTEMLGASIDSDVQREVVV